MFAGTTVPSWIVAGTTGHAANGWEIQERFLLDVQNDGADDYDDGQEDSDFP